MSCLQVSACWNASSASRISLPQSSYRRFTALHSAVPVLPPRSKWPRLGDGPRRCCVSPVRSFGGKERSNGDSDASLWKSFEKAIGNFGKGRSIEDVLQEQMKQEFDGDGGAGSPPGGDDDAGDDSEEESEEDRSSMGFIIEVIQFCLALLVGLAAYGYVLRGQEFILLAKDYVMSRWFGAEPSMRLIRTTCELEAILKRKAMREAKEQRRKKLKKIWKHHLLHEVARTQTPIKSAYYWHFNKAPEPGLLSRCITYFVELL